MSGSHGKTLFRRCVANAQDTLITQLDGALERAGARGNVRATHAETVRMDDRLRVHVALIDTHIDTVPVRFVLK